MGIIEQGLGSGIVTIVAIAIFLALVFLVDWERLWKKHREARKIERVIFDTRPAFPLRLFVTAFVLFVILMMLTGASLRSLLSPAEIDAALACVTLPVFICFALSFVGTLYQIYHWLMIRYKMTTCRVVIEIGLLGQERSIPLTAIQCIDLYGTDSIGTVIVRSAAMYGSITMFNLKNPHKYADMIVQATCEHRNALSL